MACVGGGSNAIGLFHAFKEDDVMFYGAEPGGKGEGLHSAPLSRTEQEEPEVFQGMKTKVIDEDTENHSVSAGLDYPAVGPEHAALQELGRAEYHAIPDEEALSAFRELSEAEGIIPALEPSHAIALAKKLAANAMAWLGSRAGMIPSARLSSLNASRASSSLIAWYSARPSSCKAACSGPTAG